MSGLILVDDVYPAFAADYLIIWTDFFDTCTHFHADHLLMFSDDSLLKIYLTFAVSYPTLRKIVRCQFYLNAVARYQTDVVPPHFTGDVSYYDMAVFQLYLELRSR